MLSIRLRLAVSILYGTNIIYKCMQGKEKKGKGKKEMTEVRNLLD